jgi:hypothetical protein
MGLCSDLAMQLSTSISALKNPVMAVVAQVLISEDTAHGQEFGNLLISH